ncbi:hypothetical protein GF324_13245, partial [bacterium]|nr:hypothetical protein [bacterium]
MHRRTPLLNVAAVLLLLIGYASFATAADWKTTDLYDETGIKTLAKSNPHAFSHGANHVVFTQITGDIILMTEAKKKWRAENLHETNRDAE